MKAPRLELQNSLCHFPFQIKHGVAPLSTCLDAREMSVVVSMSILKLAMKLHHASHT